MHLLSPLSGLDNIDSPKGFTTYGPLDRITASTHCGHYVPAPHADPQRRAKIAGIEAGLTLQSHYFHLKSNFTITRG